MIRTAEILGRSAPSQTHTWTERDYMLYALALGCGNDPTDEASLPFVYERRLKVIPTLPTILAWLAEPSLASLGAQVDFARHSGHKIEIHRALSEPTTVAVTGRVVAVQD